MLETLKNSLNVRSAYKTNTFIYSFKTIPVIGKLIPDTVYGEPAFKELFKIFSFIIGFITKVIMNVVLILIMYYLNKGLFDGTYISFLMMFLIISILSNLYVPVTFNTKRDADYLISNLRMNPKMYLLGTYFVDLIGMYIIQVPIYMIFLHLLRANMLIAFLLPFIYICLSIFSSCLRMMFIKNKLLKTFINLLITCGVLGFLYYYISSYEVVNFIPMIFGVFVIFIVIGLLSLVYLIKYNHYRKTFKLLHVKSLEDNEYKEANLKAITASIVLDENITSNYEGFDLIHDLFVKRHRKMLTDPVKIACYIIGSILIFMCLITYFFDIKEPIHKFIMNGMGYIAFIMYFINRGDQICKAMFMNCDCALLNYRLYRSPKTILEMFTRRLKTSIKLNLIPAGIMSVGGAILLMITGDNNAMNYILFVLTILSMSMFFSIHYLVMYYLLQPFSEKTEVKNKAYSFINILVYLFCYIPIYYEIPLPLSIIGPIVIIFTIVYSLIGLALAYKLAPKTFKIRL